MKKLKSSVGCVESWLAVDVSWMKAMRRFAKAEKVWG